MEKAEIEAEEEEEIEEEGMEKAIGMEKVVNEEEEEADKAAEEADKAIIINVWMRTGTEMSIKEVKICPKEDKPLAAVKTIENLA